MENSSLSATAGGLATSRRRPSRTRSADATRRRRTTRATKARRRPSPPAILKKSSTSVIAQCTKWRFNRRPSSGASTIGRRNSPITRAGRPAGRQGMMEAQRYPEDFDAIIAGAPVYNQIRLNLATVAPQVEMLKDPSKMLLPAKITLLANAVVAACDEKDGVKDGIVNDPPMCKFDPAVLMCKAGDGPDCLTAPQVATVKNAYAPLKLKSGELVYRGHSRGFEPQFRVPMPGAPLNPLYADTPRYLGHQDANWDIMSFDME